MTQLALQPAASRKNYYVNLYMGEETHKNRQLFIPFTAWITKQSQKQKKPQ